MEFPLEYSHRDFRKPNSRALKDKLTCGNWFHYRCYKSWHGFITTSIRSACLVSSLSPELNSLLPRSNSTLKGRRGSMYNISYTQLLQPSPSLQIKIFKFRGYKCRNLVHHLISKIEYNTLMYDIDDTIHVFTSEGTRDPVFWPKFLTTFKWYIPTNFEVDFKK